MSCQGSTRNSMVDPSHKLLMSWEKDFDFRKAMALFEENWHIPFIIVFLVYLPVIYFGQMIMSKREPFKLKIPLFIWNSSLAIFSTIGFARVLPEFLSSWKKGFSNSICSSTYADANVTNIWIFMFVVSKTPELIDTLFLVLKKQKLIFLHVYHHATVLIYSWFVFVNIVGCARWFCTMNYGVHSIMYTYFALKTLPHLIRIPKWVAMFITISQTIQMVIGTFVIAAATYIRLSGHKCEISMPMTFAGLFIYVSYLILFSHFFYTSYFAPKAQKANQVENKKKA